MTLHPDLLRACAAYLAHADAYSLDGDGQMALLREDARTELQRQVEPWRGVTRDDMERYQSELGSVRDADCDELTHAHLAVIRTYGRIARTRGGSAVGVVATALAILDATPAMLRRWCDRLSIHAPSTTR